MYVSATARGCGVGFKPVEPYEESEVPPHMRHYWLFMELEL